MRIAVYAIAKDEAANADKFLASCADADMVIVLDTGSTDGTPDLLRQAGATVYEAKIEPWRFDVAKNLALSNVPPDADICVNLDLDERLTPGWREALERAWTPGTNFASCRLVHSWQDAACTVPAVSAFHGRIHARHGFKWRRRIHETLDSIDGGRAQHVVIRDMAIHHHQQQSKARNYISLLTQHLEEYQEDADGWLQRGAGYLQQERWEEALQDYDRYLRLTREVEDPHGLYRRSLAWIDVAKLRHKLGHPDAVQALLYAAAEYPDCREAWTYLADAWMGLGNWASAYGAAMNALAITQRGPGASDEICWSDLPKQIASSAFSRIMNRGGN